MRQSYNRVSNRAFVRRALLLGTSLVAFGHGGTVTAQEQGQESDNDIFNLEEIVVTARRREESVIDVPGTVTAFSQSTLEAAGVSRIEDFVQLTAGVTVVDAAEVGDTQINIRGINGARDAENSFALLIDGVVYTNPASVNREYADLRQIEIFKGPQGAIYGRNAAAGAILVTTKKPSNELEATALGRFANDNSYFGQALVSGPIIKDQLYGSISGDFRTTDGFYRNSFQGDAPIVDAFEGYNVNARVVWEPTSTISLDTKFRYGEVDASAITFNSTFNLPVFAAAAGVPLADEDINEREFVFQPNIVSDNDQEALEISTKLDWDFDFGSISSWLLFTDIDNEFIADGTSAGFGFFAGDQTCIDTTAELTGFPLPPPQSIGESPVPVLIPGFSGLPAEFSANPPIALGSFFGAFTPTTCDGIQEQLRDQRDISFELRFSSPDDQRFRYSAGIYYLNIDRQVGVSLNTDSGETPIRGLLQLDGPNQTQALLFDDFNTDVIAVFASAEYDVLPNLEVAAALRYDRERRDQRSLVPVDAQSEVIDFDFDGTPDQLNPGVFLNGGLPIPPQEEVFDQVQPKISFRWDALEELTLFASWGVGFKAGGFNNFGSAATVDIFINGLSQPFAGPDLPPVLIEDIFEEETSSAFEWGFKSRLFGGKLQLEGAGYFIDVDNLQFFEFFVGPFGLLRVVSNVDDVQLIGGELAFNYRPNSIISFFGSANITESEIQANTSRPDTVGNKSPYTPDYTASLGAELNYPIREGLDFFMRADAQFVGPTFFHTVQEQDRPTIFQTFFAGSDFGPDSAALGLANFTNAQRDAYETLNVRMGVSGDWWSVTLFANNITLNDFVEEVIPAAEFGGSFVNPGPLRRYGGEIAFRF